MHLQLHTSKTNVTVTGGALMNADNFWKVRGGYGYLDSS